MSSCFGSPVTRPKRRPIDLVARAECALRDFSDLRIERYPHHLFLGRIWQLRENATAYDAAYLALAEALDAPLVTTDRKLAEVPGHAARVEVAGEVSAPTRPRGSAGWS
jgi:predicted nucleic acid-binding protein